MVEKLAKLQQQIIEQQKEITILKTSSLSTEKKVDILRQTVNTEKEANDNIRKSIITELSPSVTLVKEVLEKQQETIDGIQKTQNEANQAHEEVKTKVELQEEQLQKVRKNFADSIDALQQLDEKQTSQLNRITGAYSSEMAEKVDKLEIKLKGLQLSVDNSDQTMKTITDTITGHSKNLTENNNNLAGHTQQIELQATTMKALQGLVDTVNKSSDANQAAILEAQATQRSKVQDAIDALRKEITLKVESIAADTGPEKLKQQFATHDYVDEKLKVMLKHEEDIDSASRKSVHDFDIETMRTLFTPLDKFQKSQLQLGTQLEELKQTILSHQKFIDLKDDLTNFTKGEIDSLRNIQDKALSEQLELQRKTLATEYASVKDLDAFKGYCEDTFIKNPSTVNKDNTVTAALWVTPGQLNKKLEDLTQFFKENYMKTSALTNVESTDSEGNLSKAAAAQIQLIEQQYLSLTTQQSSMNEIISQWQERIQQNYEDIGELKGTQEATNEDFENFKTKQLALNVSEQAHLERLDETNKEQEKRWDEFHNFHWRFVDKKVTRLDKEIKKHEEIIEDLEEWKEKLQELLVDLEHYENTMTTLDQRITNSSRTMNNNFRAFQGAIDRLRDHINQFANQPVRVIRQESLQTAPETPVVSTVRVPSNTQKPTSPTIVVEPPNSPEKTQSKVFEDASKKQENTEGEDNEYVDAGEEEGEGEGFVVETTVSEEASQDGNSVKNSNQTVTTTTTTTTTHIVDPETTIEENSSQHLSPRDAETQEEDDEYEDEIIEAVQLVRKKWSESYHGVDVWIDESLKNQLSREGDEEEDSPDTWQSALSSECFSKGVYLWAIKINSIGKDTQVFIGVAEPEEFNVQKDNLGNHPRAWGLNISDGTVRHNNNARSFIPNSTKFSAGDVVHVLLNLADNSISFSPTQEDLGDETALAFESGVTGPLAPAISISPGGSASFTFL